MKPPQLLSTSGHYRQRNKFGGLPQMDLETRNAVRRRLERSPFISNAFELGRLRIRLDQLNQSILHAVNGERQRLISMKAECEKAIATLALAGNGEKP